MASKMFTVHPDTDDVLRTFQDEFPHVVTAIRSAIVLGTDVGRDEEGGSEETRPFELIEQLALCRRYVEFFIVTPYRAAVALPNLAKKYDKTDVVFSFGDRSVALVVDSAAVLKALDDFVENLSELIASYRPPRSADEPQPPKLPRT